MAVGEENGAPPTAEIQYLEALVRGVYAKKDLPSGHQLTEDDVYLAIPLQKDKFVSRISER